MVKHKKCKKVWLYILLKMIAVLGENWNVETQAVKTDKGTDLSQQMHAK